MLPQDKNVYALGLCTSCSLCSELFDQHLAHLLLIFQDSPQRSLAPCHLAQATNSLTAPHHKARNT